MTALRWARILRDLGHRVRVGQCYHRASCDLLIALHAIRSAASIERFRARHPAAPLIVALAGTDMYAAAGSEAVLARSLELADAVVVLQPLALERLPDHLRSKAHVIYQSCEPDPNPRHHARDGRRTFDVCVLGNLRPVKDPFLAAEAARLLPADSRVRILHVGAALSAEMEQRAVREQRRNRRYRWLGGRPRARARAILADCDVLAHTSSVEGGANAVMEAIANDVPVIATRIEGSVGILGADYPGYCAVGDAGALAELLRRAEITPAFLAELRRCCRDLSALTRPSREKAAWADLLRRLSAARSRSG